MSPHQAASQCLDDELIIVCELNLSVLNLGTTFKSKLEKSETQASCCVKKYCKLNIRNKDFRPFISLSVMLRQPPLDSESGWTGELWSKTNFLKRQN